MRYRKWLTLLLSVILIVSLAIPVFAEDGSGKIGTNAYWRYDSATQTLTVSGTGDIIIDTYSQPPWKEHYYGDIHRVIVKEGITGLGGEVFSYLPYLAEVQLPSSLKSMGGEVFLLSGDSSLDIVIPDGMTDIGDAFHMSHIRSIKLGKGITELCEGAFQYSSVVSVDLCNVKKIGEKAFGSCTQLQNIDLSGVTEIGGAAFARCSALTYADIHNVTLIKGETFRASGIERIVFGRSLLQNGTIYAYNFNRNNLKQIFIQGTRSEYQRLLDRSAKDENEGLYEAQIIPVPFEDVAPMRWSAPAVYQLAEAGVLGGYGDGSFRPTNQVTRAEFAKMLTMVLPNDKTVPTTPRSFPDVKESAWYAQYVKTLAGRGIVNGFEDGTFRPNAQITRQDMATMIGRMVELYGLNLPEKASPVSFKDAGAIATYAASAVSQMQRVGIINGFEDQTFRPKEHASREQTAQMIYNLLQAMQYA